MASIKIGGIEKFSIVDFPNRISSVVFMQGCPWRCPFCHNVHLQKLNAETNISWPKFIDFLKQRQGMLDAVVFSGGEPLMQPDLLGAITEVKNLGYEIGLHTGGYLPQRFKEIIPHIDWVGFDIKAPLEEKRYKEITGGIADVNKIKESLEMLCHSNKNFECRTTCDPRFLSIDDLYLIANQLKQLGVKEYHLQKYRKIPSDSETTDEQCQALIENSDLLAYLQKCFTTFDVRS